MLTPDTAESGRYHTVIVFASDTETSNAADTLPAVATILAEPLATPVTVPSDDTVATFGSVEPHVTVLFVAFDGETVAESFVVEPTDTVFEPLTDTIDTGTVTVPAAFTTTEAVADLPFAEETVMVALPAFTAFTRPVEDTVATEGSELFHDTVLSVAFDGETVADSCLELPTVSDREDGDTDTEDTATSGVLQVTSESDVSPTFQPTVPPA